MIVPKRLGFALLGEDSGYCELATAAAIWRRAVGGGFVLNREGD